MQTSDKGIALIKKYEGFSAVVYRCPAGKLTIGYGHMLKTGEDFTTITEYDADGLLRVDVMAAEHAVNALVKVALTQGQFDALVSFVYNLGATHFKNSTLLKRLNEGNYEVAGDNFQKWVYGGGKKLEGLVRRRAAEWALFTGKADDV